jgi:putative hemolysin
MTAAILVCVLMTFLFAGIEAGVLSVNRVRLRHNALDGDESAQILEKLLAQPTRLTATVVLVQFAARSLGLGLLFAAVAGWFGPIGGSLAFVAAIPFLSLCLEFFPKALFRRLPFPALVFFARMLQAFSFLLAPFSILAEKAAGPLLRLASEKSSRRLASVSEIRKAINEAADRGDLLPKQKHFMHSLLNGRETTALNLAVQKNDMISVRPDADIKEATGLSKATGMDRLPVTDRQGNIQGILSIFDLLIDGTEKGRAISYCRRPVQVYEDEAAIEVLAKLRAARTSMATVLRRKDDQPLGILPAERIVRKLLLG